MKKLIFLILVAISGLFFSCEEVIDVDLDTQDPKLVIEAFINIQKNAGNHDQFIRLTETTGYFNHDIPKASGAQVTMISLADNSTIPFVETEAGIYRTSAFEGEVGDTFKLVIVYKNETYEAEETIVQAPEIDRIEQSEFSSFLGKTTQVTAYFQDDASAENYYFIQWFYKDKRAAQQLLSDEFFNGNMMDNSYLSYDEDKEIVPNQDITVSVTAISSTAYSYLFKILDVSANAGNPFASPMGVIRGNIKNRTNPKNYALGYFAVTQSTLETYRTH